MILSRMGKQMRPEEKRDVTYETVRVSDLRVGRRGKHHELLTGILKNLEDLPAGSALVVPLESIGKVSLGCLPLCQGARPLAGDVLGPKEFLCVEEGVGWSKATGGTKSAQVAAGPQLHVKFNFSWRA